MHSDGRVRWIAPSSFDVQRVVDLANFALQEGNAGGNGSPDDNVTWVVPVTAAITPGFLTIVVGTADGMMLTLPSANGEAGDAEDFDAEAFADAGADVVVNKRLDFHADSVYAVCSLNTEPPALFTAAADGSVRLWDALGTMLFEALSTQPFVCASSSKHAPLVALGTADGMLRLVRWHDLLWTPRLTARRLKQFTMTNFSGTPPSIPPNSAFASGCIHGRWTCIRLNLRNDKITLCNRCRVKTVFAHLVGATGVLTDTAQLLVGEATTSGSKSQHLPPTK